LCPTFQNKSVVDNKCSQRGFETVDYIIQHLMKAHRIAASQNARSEILKFQREFESVANASFVFNAALSTSERVASGKTLSRPKNDGAGDVAERTEIISRVRY